MIFVTSSQLFGQVSTMDKSAEIYHVLKKRQLVKLGFPKLWNILRKRFTNSCAKFTFNCRMPVQQPAIAPTILTCYRRSCRAGWAGQPRGSSINSNNYSNKSHYELLHWMFAYTNIYYYSPQGDCKIKTKIHQYLRVSRGYLQRQRPNYWIYIC